MKIFFSLLLTFSLSLSADTIKFNHADSIYKRDTPSVKDTLLSYNSIIKNTTSSIVHISTSQKVHSNIQMQEFLEEFFGRRFSQKTPSQKKTMGLGSGVILSKEGYIVTNNHVIDKADEITVTIANTKKEYPAKIIGKDPKTDIAVIKIETKDELTPILLGDSSLLKVGDIVFAIGNPFGVGQSVTQGIISAQQKSSIGINEYENFIQTDASINPGNSGGALVDSRGALIGINSAILSKSGGNNGIGFAIEINMVENIVKKLINSGKIIRGYMGVKISDFNNDLNELYKNKIGALLVDVSESTPAYKAGLKRGDLVLKINKKIIKNASDLKNSIGLLEPGEKISLEYERDKKIYTTQLKLEDENKIYQNSEELLKGLKLLSLNQNIRFKYKIPTYIEGVLIQEVALNSEGYNKGLKEGDIIVQIENIKINSIDILKNTIKKYKNRYKRIYINRDGQIYMIAYK